MQPRSGRQVGERNGGPSKYKVIEDEIVVLTDLRNLVNVATVRLCRVDWNEKYKGDTAINIKWILRNHYLWASGNGVALNVAS